MWQPNGNQVLAQRAWVSGAALLGGGLRVDDGAALCARAQFREQQLPRTTTSTDLEVDRSSAWTASTSSRAFRRPASTSGGSARPRPADKFDAERLATSRRRRCSTVRARGKWPSGTASATSPISSTTTTSRRSAWALNYYYRRHNLKFQADFGQVETHLGPSLGKQTAKELRVQTQFISEPGGAFELVAVQAGGPAPDAREAALKGCATGAGARAMGAGRPATEWAILRRVTGKGQHMKRINTSVVALAGSGWPSSSGRPGDQGGRRAGRLSEGQRRLGQPQQHRLRHDEQHDDALGRDVPEVLPERQDPGRGQGIVDGAAGADRRHGAVRPDVAGRCAPPRSISSSAKYGYKPTELRTSYDALAVYVHKDNPIAKLSLAQVEAIFGKSRKRGYKQNITTWGQLGLTGDWANRPISLYGRNSASGTYGFFKEHASSRTATTRTPSRSSRARRRSSRASTEDRYGIGYSGIGYRTSGVKAVPLAETDKGPISDGSYADVTSGKYPLSALPLHLRQQGAGQAARPAGRRVREADVQQGRPGGGREGRLHAAVRHAGAGGAGKDCRPRRLSRRTRRHICLSVRLISGRARGGPPDFLTNAREPGRPAAGWPPLAADQAAEAHRSRGRGVITLGGLAVVAVRHRASSSSSRAEAVPLFRRPTPALVASTRVATGARGRRSSRSCARLASTNTRSYLYTIESDAAASCFCELPHGRAGAESSRSLAWPERRSSPRRAA